MDPRSCPRFGLTAYVSAARRQNVHAFTHMSRALQPRSDLMHDHSTSISATGDVATKLSRGHRQLTAYPKPGHSSLSSDCTTSKPSSLRSRRADRQPLFLPVLLTDLPASYTFPGPWPPHHRVRRFLYTDLDTDCPLSNVTSLTHPPVRQKLSRAFVGAKDPSV
ncbi:hypothetical protein B0H10DRAFT_1955021 [Mycena sp. CBHHK59/15]|nr:hypothetical protein B0H10DRAFT_1955021 [Mycena sp. CBHHK59/15]